uniref:C2H2-type domain-containing protein n=1 Tax=Amorphochlora amoebiformis TaxID=1561963 RepID=A0A7S0GP10_9EUKA|mmetsp:Transcript_1502/g.2130  ORF Transcript_1502/g.2130 Transcript_1502/m.2130 type:complete len:244 (+) Transcript_1502:58-789(+)
MNIWCRMCRAYRSLDGFEFHMLLHKARASEGLPGRLSKWDIFVMSQYKSSGPGKHCQICGKVFFHSSGLKAHLYYHIPGRFFKCSMCNESYKYPEGLKCHIKQVHSFAGFTCPICNRTFGYRNQLEMHMLIHRQELPFNCSQCFKRFRQRGQLKVHMRSHTGESPYHCSYCFRSFKWRGQLEKHEAYQHLGEGIMSEKIIQMHLNNQKFERGQRCTPSEEVLVSKLFTIHNLTNTVTSKRIRF